MLGSLLFGAYHHYVAISPDHVAHLPPGDAQGLFRVTAQLMVVVELLGAGVGIAGLLAAETPSVDEPRGT